MTSVFPFNAAQILCPVDRSELSGLALKYAVVGARVFGASGKSSFELDSERKRRRRVSLRRYR